MLSKFYLITIILLISTCFTTQNSVKTVNLKSEVDDLNSNFILPERLQVNDNKQQDDKQNYPVYPQQYPSQYPFLPLPGGGCPFCEPTVFSYCYEKRLHDACCCSPYGPYYNRLKYPGGYGYPGGIGYQCQYQDCRFLFANSCEEGILISECCCNLL